MELLEKIQTNTEQEFEKITQIFVIGDFFYRLKKRYLGELLVHTEMLVATRFWSFLCQRTFYLALKSLLKIFLLIKIHQKTVWFKINSFIFKSTICLKI